jgi:hypothetical protein
MPSTVYAINKEINYRYGGTSASYVPPATYYMGLSTTVLSATDTSGSAATEPTSGSYARVPLTNNKSTWSTATAGSIVNLISASFVQSSSSWGTIVSAFLADSSAVGTGNIWDYYTLSPSVVVQANTVVPIDAGNIIATRT